MQENPIATEGLVLFLVVPAPADGLCRCGFLTHADAPAHIAMITIAGIAVLEPMR